MQYVTTPLSLAVLPQEKHLRPAAAATLPQLEPLYNRQERAALLGDTHSRRYAARIF